LVPGFGVLGLLVASWIKEVADRVFKLLHFGARGTAAAYSRKYVEGFFELDASTFVVVHSLLLLLAYFLFLLLTLDTLISRFFVSLYLLKYKLVFLHS
jgi:hypothetical protein